MQTCAKGHLLDQANLIKKPTGKTKCRTCSKANQRGWNRSLKDYPAKAA